MLIADAQVHLWAADTPARPWPVKNPPHIPHHGWPSFSKDQLLREMDAAGVQRVVVVPPGWEGEHNDVALQAAHQQPDRFAVMGRLRLDAPDARAQIATWRQQPGMLGLRFTFGRQNYPMEDWLWAEAEAAGVPIMAQIRPNDLHLVGQAAQRYPKLKLVIDHLGIPSRSKDEASFAHLDLLLALAKHPNIAVKASALPSFTTDCYPYRRLHPYLRQVYNAFGPRRIFWGTDITSLPCTYRQAITMFTDEIPWLTDEDKEWIMGRGLCEWIRWPLPK